MVIKNSGPPPKPHVTTVTAIYIDSYLDNLGRGTFSKIIVVAREKDWQDFSGRGYVLEGVNPGYYLGQPGYYMARFLTAERESSQSPDNEDKILRELTG